MPFPAAVVGLPACVTGFPLPPLGPGTILDGVPNVLVGPAALPAAIFGSLVSPHGNPVNPKMPGYNPLCADAMIDFGSPTVYCGGFPMARVTSTLLCGQHVVSLGIPTVMVGP